MIGKFQTILLLVLLCMSTGQSQAGTIISSLAGGTSIGKDFFVVSSQLHTTAGGSSVAPYVTGFSYAPSLTSVSPPLATSGAMVLSNIGFVGNAIAYHPFDANRLRQETTGGTLKLFGDNPLQPLLTGTLGSGFVNGTMWSSVATFSVEVIFDGGVISNALDPQGRLLLTLGQVKTDGAPANGLSRSSIASPLSPFSSSLTFQITGTARSVVPVPEPASMVGFAVMSLGLLHAKFRRQRNARVTA